MITFTKSTTYRRALSLLAPATLAATLLTPALALACPTARASACGGCGGHSSIGGYLIAVGLGLLAGATSVGLEARFRGPGNHGDR